MGQGTVNQLYPVRLQLSDGATNQYPRATIYNSAGSLVATLSLTHIANGLYGTSYTPLIVGTYSIAYLVYSDSGHTTLAAYNFSLDELVVSATSTNTATVPVSPPVTDVISMFRGDDFSKLVTAYAAGPTGALALVDMTGGSARLTVKKKKSDTANILQKTGVVQSPGTAGQVLFSIVPADTASVVPDQYFYDVQVTTAAGLVYTVIASTFELKYDVTTS